MPNFYRSGPFPVYRRTFIPVSRTLEPAPAPKLAEPLKKALTSYISATGVVGECGDLWRPCHSAGEMRRMRGRQIETILRLENNQTKYDNCRHVREFR